MTHQEREKALNRIPDVKTAMSCVKSLLKYHRFDNDEHLYRDDLRVAISRIEAALTTQCKCENWKKAYESEKFISDHNLKCREDLRVERDDLVNVLKTTVEAMRHLAPKTTFPHLIESLEQYLSKYKGVK